MRTREKLALEKRLNALADAIEAAASRVRSNKELLAQTQPTLVIHVEKVVVSLRGKPVEVVVNEFERLESGLPLDFVFTGFPDEMLRLLPDYGQLVLKYDEEEQWWGLTPVQVIEQGTGQRIKGLIESLNGIGR